MINQKIHLEDVFKTSGVPTHTFVEPKKYPELLLNLRTPGRGLVVEGPSGIGKTCAIETAIHKLGMVDKVTRLSARRPQDIEYIELLPGLKDAGAVLVDDFHRLPTQTRTALADYMKTLADTEAKTTKVVVLGINRAGDNLVQLAPDLVNRIDVVRFESEPDSKIEDLIARGEDALKIQITVRDDIIRAAQGSFYLAQMLCKEVCMYSGILERCVEMTPTRVSFEGMRASVWDRLGMSFKKRCEDFCRGSRLRREGRAPYLHILNWLAIGESWTLDLRDQIRHHSDLRGSVSQVVDKGFLRDLLASNEDLRQVLHFDQQSDQLTVEDPQFLFYIRNIPWRHFARELGYISVEFDRRYDFALSFAGTDRDVAESLFVKLSENELEVFYDKNEQHRILAEDVEEYLRPIYQSEAHFVVVLLGRDYPTRVWTKIESDAFRERFKDGHVIPIWFSDAPPGLFDQSRQKGGITLQRDKDINTQIAAIVDLLLKKLAEARTR